MPMSTYDSDNEELDERKESTSCTLLTYAVHQRLLAEMKTKPDMVLTFDHDAELLCDWVWPSMDNDIAIEPAALKKVLTNNGIEPPVCFCSRIRNDKLITTPTELIKRNNVWQFSCRRQDGCGYLVKLDAWNPRLATREPLKTLATRPNDWSFTRARWSRLCAETTVGTSGPGQLAPSHDTATSSGGQAVAGPSRTVKSIDHVNGRKAPYNIAADSIEERPEKHALMLSPPRMTLERVRRPYGSVQALPAQPTETSPAPPRAAAPSDHIPGALLDIAYLTTTDGVSAADFNTTFVRCKCGKYVYRAALDTVHPTFCTEGPLSPFLMYNSCCNRSYNEIPTYIGTKRLVLRAANISYTSSPLILRTIATPGRTFSARILQGMEVMLSKPVASCATHKASLWSVLNGMLSVRFLLRAAAKSHLFGLGSSIKTCSLMPIEASDLAPRISTAPTFNDAEKQLFTRTFAFYCALRNTGCCFRPTETSQQSEDDTYDDIDDPDLGNVSADAFLSRNTDDIVRDSRAPKRELCDGHPVLHDKDGRIFIRCSLRRSGALGHLSISGIEQYDTEYLRALLEDDYDTALVHETRAASSGYGPLAPCARVAPASSPATCSDWHRVSGGGIQRGSLVSAGPCTAKCAVYTPRDLHKCPFVAVVCTGPHNHPLPPPVQTPQIVRQFFKDALRSLDWQLSFMTPRRLACNLGFLQRLRTALGWTQSHHPVLSDLHPSLGNHDHVAYLIGSVREAEYPHGTGFKSAVKLLERQASLSAGLLYVRVAKELQLHGKTFRYVICMLPEQSEILRSAKRVSVDTAFRRVRDWKELELETWDDSSHRSITCARVFLNLLSAEAHKLVLQDIYGIVEEDCEAPLQFSYMHGTGWDTVIADEHSGEALGFGQFALWVAVKTLLATNAFTTMSAYEQLSYFYMLCLSHYKRNLRGFNTSIPSNILDAMH
ncbi:hypothetical protein AURDEDRAFT_155120, partial [Auricularia subglabra TFB-10046 SS5]